MTHSSDTQADADAGRITLATPPRMELTRIAALLPAALDSGVVACVRLDMPGASEDDLRRACDALRPLCHDRDIAFVISDHFRLVRPLGLDGVEVDAARVRLRDARAEIGAGQILGARCGASRHAGMVAAEAGADYVLFSPVSASALGDGEAAAPELFDWWAQMIVTPCVAEGGVDEALARRLGGSVDFIVPDPTVWEGDLPAALRALDAASRAASAPRAAEA